MLPQSILALNMERFAFFINDTAIKLLFYQLNTGNICMYLKGGDHSAELYFVRFATAENILPITVFVKWQIITQIHVYIRKTFHC